MLAEPDTESTAHPPKEPGMTQTICFALPIVPGATDADRDEMLACWRGDRAGGHHASRARHGITREATWIQSTPGGDVAIVLLESDDLAASLFGVATSDDPFDVWFRSHVRTVHGIDLAAGMNLPEQVLDFSS